MAKGAELLKLAVEPLDKRFLELTVQDDGWMNKLPESSKPDHIASEGLGW
ncbi:hypothetical protein [Streptomyces endophyticus]|uniref:Uncharacterized protein n=1 Tax=Streptomyces endophyticus TaxID=714166 RepID=A0ABU6EZC1_9ACTN|nr:hypothetical protein [Streptomyces endophyticus]MEB8337086.1 hypothetical protein [Streptomyces endophyticus]